MHIVLISIVLDFSGLVLAEAVLSYVGVGVDPTMNSWGNMINGARLELAREPMVWWSLLARLRLHVRAGAGGQPVRRRGARCLRSAREMSGPLLSRLKTSRVASWIAGIGPRCARSTA